MYDFISSWSTPLCTQRHQAACGCKTRPNHYPFTTVLILSMRLFVLICCVLFLFIFLLRCSLLGSLWVVLTHRPGLKAAKMSAFIEVLALPDDQFFKSILAAPGWYTCSLDYLYVICFPLPYTESCEYFYK